MSGIDTSNFNHDRLGKSCHKLNRDMLRMCSTVSCHGKCTLPVEAEDDSSQVPVHIPTPAPDRLLAPPFVLADVARVQRKQVADAFEGAHAQVGVAPHAPRDAVQREICHVGGG